MNSANDPNAGAGSVADITAAPPVMKAAPGGDPSLAVTADTTADAQSTYLPQPKRHGVALCLSGGGSRAALFHLGVLRRLNETGVLSQVETITSVSGGSILAGHLAACVAAWPSPGGVIPDFEEQIARPFAAFVHRNLRTAPIARRYLFPRNWRNDQTQIDALTKLFETYLNGGRLADLPPTPQYIFCASDDAFAVNWTFARDTMGDYEAGYMPPGRWTVARAVAASACFPPVFDAMKTHLKPADMQRGDYRRDDRDQIIRGLRLSDGGLYDNLALEPVWKDHAIVIVSDGGSLFEPRADQGLLKRLEGYINVMGRQGTSLRKRWLIAGYAKGVLQGVYLGVGTPVANYKVQTQGYSPDLVEEIISQVRTDLDAFSDAEIAVLQNHGYFVAEAGLRKHLAATGLPIRWPSLSAPYGDWLDEQKVRAALADSAKTRLPFGRGPWLRYLGPRWLWPRR